ncbi:MAG: hypothetical protein K2Q45_06705 [Nitrosomonas sp.]|nr:hypothetical protein [Nitrosomonas sp.]
MEELFGKKCEGHGHLKKTLIKPMYGYGKQTEIRVDDWTTTKIVPYLYFDNGCILCAQEMQNECKVRKQKAKKLEKNQQIVNESLKQKSARVVARDPNLILMATYKNDPPLTEDIWKVIHDAVPTAMTKEYNDILAESERANNAHWMYTTLGVVFSRYSGSVGKKRKIAE